jgi:hypothetical protein
VLAGLPPGPNARVREAEQQHVTDWENGAEVIAESGVHAEQSMRRLQFSSQAECEQQSSDAVTRALRDGRRRVGYLSRETWDLSGRHRIWQPPRYLKK